MQVGIKVVHRQLPDTVSQADVESVVKATCDDQAIDGILVQVRKLVFFKRNGVLPSHANHAAVPFTELVTAAPAAKTSG